MPVFLLLKVVYLLSLLSINSILISPVLAFSCPFSTGHPGGNPPYPADSPGWDPEDPPTSISLLSRFTPLLSTAGLSSSSAESESPSEPLSTASTDGLLSYLPASGRFIVEFTAPKAPDVLPTCRGVNPVPLPERPAPLAVPFPPNIARGRCNVRDPSRLLPSIPNSPHICYARKH